MLAWEVGIQVGASDSASVRTPDANWEASAANKGMKVCLNGCDGYRTQETGRRDTDSRRRERGKCGLEVKDRLASSDSEPYGPHESASAAASIIVSIIGG